MAVLRTLFPDPGDYGCAMATWSVSVLGAILGFVVSGILTARRQRRANRRVSTGAAAPWTYSRRKTPRNAQEPTDWEQSYLFQG
jgi:hypothetical protein